MTNRIACSPLTGRIQQGRLNKANNAFIGDPKDVTSDVLRAVVEKAEFHGGAFPIGNGSEVWDVTVTKRATEAAKQGEHPCTSARES